MTEASLDHAQKVVADLVERFRLHYDDYTSPDYKETRLRVEFIDPFFEALGKEGSLWTKKPICEESSSVSVMNTC